MLQLNIISKINLYQVRLIESFYAMIAFERLNQYLLFERHLMYSQNYYSCQYTYISIY